jgi:hypothetical protein
MPVASSLHPLPGRILHERTLTERRKINSLTASFRQIKKHGYSKRETVLLYAL